MNNEYKAEKEEAMLSSIKQEADRQEEKDNLEKYVDIIKAEILKYIGKRKELSEYILEYRKNVMDEYRDDEDKITEYFDHERFVKEEAFKNIDRRLKELLILKYNPYFGRVDFKEEDSDNEEKIYIGRFGVTPEGSYEPLVVDWRAPISALFYNSELGKSKYNAPMGQINTDVLLKRQFVIKRGVLEGFFDSALDVKDAILQMVLTRNSSEKLKDIVMTIQREQDEIIRQPLHNITVVNGVAGSGKTTIALHRVAYLLYNYRDTLQDKVLILGPNGIFMEYISTVLPSLGEVGVKQRTFNEYAMSLLKIDTIMPFRDYMEKIVSGDKEFINDVIFKQSKEFIHMLDRKIEDIDNDYFDIEDVYLKDRLIIDKDGIRELFESYKDMPLFRRSKKVRRILFRKISDVRDEIVWNIQRKYKEKVASMSKHELELYGNEMDLERRNAIRETIRAVLNCKETLKWLSEGDITEIYENICNSPYFTQDDLSPMLYLMIKLNGRNNKELIKHVVIDEAQDYSLLQFIVIKMITDCKSMTIVGDANQRMIPYTDELPMQELEKIYSDLKVNNFYLDKSYRSTQEIMEYANTYLEENKIIPLVRHGSEVNEINCDSDEKLTDIINCKINAFKEEGYETVAIITENIAAARNIHGLINEKVKVSLLDNEDIIFSGGNVVIPVYYAKGLEFDAVIIIKEDNDIFSEDSRLNYITCTRALHQLHIIKRTRKG
ncbi:HelD family protein [Clostridium oryzae]|uniref:Helicase IV n=1 Tax=Clostridium oryzae TaxID=1450648 RepID=A0A1V4IUG4_9CLOT|nr:UvrD-helicase domain-containing protein [Clostridium oryzae]OPJ63559.1 helicase IV [Clostridium oryzae]